MVGPVGWVQHEKEQVVGLTNLSERSIENIQENDCLTNLIGAKKNAASAVTDNGVKSDKKAANFRGNDTPKRRRSAMSLYGKDAHKWVAKAIGYALNLGTESAWRGLTIVLMARLSDEERAALAFAALSSLSDDHAYLTASVALYGVLDGEVLA